MISILQNAGETLAGMRDGGVTLDPASGTPDDYAFLITTDPDVAKKYDMHDESEFWSDDDNGEVGSEDEESKKPQSYRWPGAKLKDGSITDY